MSIRQVDTISRRSNTALITEHPAAVARSRKRAMRMIRRRRSFRFMMIAAAFVVVAGVAGIQAGLSSAQANVASVTRASTTLAQTPQPTEVAKPEVQTADAPVPAVKEDAGTLTANRSLRIRSTPSMLSDNTIGTLPAGVRVSVAEVTANGWFLISLTDKAGVTTRGYVGGAYVTYVAN